MPNAATGITFFPFLRAWLVFILIMLPIFPQVLKERGIDDVSINVVEHSNR